MNAWPPGSRSRTCAAAPRHLPPGRRPLLARAALEQEAAALHRAVVAELTAPLAYPGATGVSKVGGVTPPLL